LALGGNEISVAPKTANDITAVWTANFLTSITKMLRQPQSATIRR
jgi:hypothetical protein